MENDETAAGGSEELTLDEAAAAYSKSQAPREPKGQPDATETDEAQADDELQASDEDVSETEDGDPDEEGQADEETDDEPGSDHGRYVAKNGKVKLEDGSTVTVDDLIKGNLRDRDYRQKTMEAAEVRKAAEAQSSVIKQRETQLTQREQLALNVIGTFLKEPDPSLADPNSPNFDPIGYQQQDVQFKQWNRIVGEIQQHLQQSAQTKLEDVAKSEREKADKEWNALTDKLPTLKDSKKADSFANDLKSYLSSYEFGPQDMKAMALDHRLALIADKARRWDNLQANKPKVQQKTENRPAVLKGGKRLGSADMRARGASAAIAKAQQTGREDDVVAAYLATRKTG